MWRLSVLLCVFTQCIYPTYVARTPTDSNAYAIHARHLKENGNYNAALKYARAATTLSPDNAQHWFSYAYLCTSLGLVDEAVNAYQQVLAHAPNSIQALYNIAYALKMNGDIDRAITFYDAVLKRDPTYEPAHFGRGMALITKGDFTHGWQAHERYLKRSGKNADDLRALLAADAIADKIICLLPEGGLGDTLQFIRYAQILHDMGATTILSCPPPLVKLLQDCPYLDQVIPTTDGIPGHHASASLMSLPAVFNTTHETMPDTVPYLHADSERINYWQQELRHDHNFKIGICWQASVHNDSSRLPVAHRGIPLTALLPLTLIKDVSVYSLQKHDGIEELTTLPHWAHITVFDENFDTKHGAFVDTTALMHTLDLVISVDTATAHLAGALARPVWLMLPYATDWRWGTDETHSPWYPTMNIFKQHTPMNWSHVAGDLINTLLAHLNYSLDEKLTYAEVLMQHDCHDTAWHVLQELTKSPPQDHSIRLRLGNLLLNLGNHWYGVENFDQALDAYNLVASLFPRSSTGHYNIGFTQAQRAHPHEAIAAYEHALACSPNDIGTHVEYATALLAAGNYDDGWREYEWRWQLPEKQVIRDTLPLWNDTDNIHNKTIILRNEGALGDCLQFVRYAQLVKDRGATVIVQAPGSLHALLSQCPYIDTLISPTHHCTADYHTSLMSLPAVCNTMNTPMPYLFADDTLVHQWHSRVNAKQFNIGLCWQADLANDANRPHHARRSLPLTLFEGLSTIDNITLYSLQKDNPENADWLIPTPEDFDTTHGAFMDTAALMQNLDCVVTVDTAVAHLAGALGVPTLLILPHKADWRWHIIDNQTAWYPSMKVFQHTTEKPWELIMAQIYETLVELSTIKRNT